MNIRPYKEEDTKEILDKIKADEDFEIDNGDMQGENWTLLENVKYPCQLSISEKLQDKCKEYTTKLVINTCDDWFDEGHNAFLCETADGKDYLIGSDERPYPVVSIVQTHPEKATDSQLTEASIQWVSSKKPPIIVE